MGVAGIPAAGGQATPRATELIDLDVVRLERRCVVPQNANAPTLVGKPLYDAPQAPTREQPVEPATRPRSWLVPFTRYLMIFAAGIVATLVWQSWSGTAKEALRVAAREAICPQATPVAQGTPDKTSTPLSLPAKPLPQSAH
jgi:hypothetical protein